MNASDFIGNNAVIKLYNDVNELCWKHRCKYASSQTFMAVLLNLPDVQVTLKQKGIEKIDVIANGQLRLAEKDLKSSANYAVGNDKDPIGNEFTKKAAQIFEATGEDISKFSRIKRAVEENDEINADKQRFLKVLRYDRNFEEAVEKACIAAEVDGKDFPDGFDILKEAYRGYSALTGIEDALKRFGITRELILIDDEAYLNDMAQYKPEFRGQAVNKALFERELKKRELKKDEEVVPPLKKIDTLVLDDVFLEKLKLALKNPEIRNLIVEITRTDNVLPQVQKKPSGLDDGPK
jgi:uncharacterized protein YifE (UPF0438 family)